MSFRPMPFLTLCMIAGLAVLIWLGSWQWMRFQEKSHQSQEIPVTGFVSVKGEVLDAPIQFAYTTYNGEALWRSFTPVKGCLKTSDKKETCNVLAFVDRGLLSAVKPTEVGLVFTGQAYTADELVVVDNNNGSVFSPSNSPDKGIWYTANADRMAEALKLSGFERVMLLEPKMIDRIRKSQDGKDVRDSIANPFANPAKLDDLPPARHLGYALTWFGLAAALIAVYLAFHKSAGRLRFGPQKTTAPLKNE